MTEWLAVLTGLAAGAAHVALGPDHLAAVLPMAARDRIRAASIGALWGLGHGAGVVGIGLLGQAVRGSFDLTPLATGSELLVGVLLVGLGAWTLYKSRAVVIHTHDHAHDGDTSHPHIHVHLNDPTIDADDHASTGRHAHRHSALGFGLLHGVAGAGHLFGVLASLALEWPAAVAYLTSYLVAAVAAMTAFAWLVGLIAANERRLPMTLRIAGITSMVVGVFWVGQTLAA